LFILLYVLYVIIAILYIELGYMQIICDIVFLDL